MKNEVLIAHIENQSMGYFMSNAEGITYPVLPAPNGKVEDIKVGQFLRCHQRSADNRHPAYYLEVVSEDAVATEQEWREQEMEYDNPLAKHFTIDINPETLAEWVKKNEDPCDLYAKGIDDYFEEITKEVMEHFSFGIFQTIDDITSFDYVTYQGNYPIKRVWKYENDDVKIFDFENEINQHRFQMVFIAKTLEGLDLIDKYLNKIQHREWLMNVEYAKFIFLEIAKESA